LEEEDFDLRQNFLKEAHQFSSQMADVIITQALNDKPSELDPNFLESLKKARDEHREKDAGSGHGLPSQFSITNLLRAIDDMLVRVEEKAQSISTPDHKRTNDLSIKEIEKIFEKDAKIGGILSGGSVYLELVRKIAEKYGESPLASSSFVIAVDKERNKAVFEASENDDTTQTVVIVDDMIDKGGTLLTALWATGEQFPNATIYSSKGIDRPGSFQKRYLENLFQDFADLSIEGKNTEALTLFDQAVEYARKNGVELQPGWYKRKERIENKLNKVK
jgi:hypothetical protein